MLELLQHGSPFTLREALRALAYTCEKIEKDMPVESFRPESCAINLEDVADLLDGAAEELEGNGHTKGSLTVNSGEKCLIGALAHAQFNYVDASYTTAQQSTYEYRVYIRALQAVIHEVRLEVVDEVLDGDDSFDRDLSLEDTITDWNDCDDTSTLQVLNALRFSAKRLRSGETL